MATQKRLGSVALIVLLLGLMTVPALAHDDAPSFDEFDGTFEEFCEEYPIGECFPPEEEERVPEEPDEVEEVDLVRDEPEEAVDARLPFTGSNVWGLLLAGLFLVGAGLLLMRRRHAGDGV
jgi:LPXTG-motif cell wall-anchored protein